MAGGEFERSGTTLPFKRQLDIFRVVALSLSHSRVPPMAELWQPGRVF